MNTTLSPTLSLNIIRFSFYTIAVLLAFVQGWANRFDFYFGDSISYLDMANYAQTGEWDKFANGYWSPLYPLIMAAFLHIGQPLPYWEMVFVKMINLLIFTGAIACFEFFLDRFIAYAERIKTEADSVKIPSIVWRLVGYSLFLSAFLVLGGVDQDAPDILMAALLLVAIGIALEITNNNSISNYIWLGLTLGLAYLSKAIMLPISLAVFAALFFVKLKDKKSWGKLLVSMAIFVFTCLPWPIFVAKHRDKFDPFISSKITYMTFVAEAFASEAKWNVVMKTLDHPVRLIFRMPKTLEFAKPVAGVYPLWYDPSYWYSGLKVKFDLLKTAFAAICNLWYYFETFLFVPIVILLIAWMRERRFPITLRDLVKTAIILLPVLCALLCYMGNINAWLFTCGDRYFIAFYILSTLGLMLSLKLKRSATLIIISGTVVTVACFMLIPRIGSDIIKFYSTQNSSGWQIAEALRESGLKKGDLVARVGTDLLYWAEPYKFKVGADITNSKEFWGANDQTRNKLIDTLKKAGFKAIVYRPSKYPHYRDRSRAIHDLTLVAKLLQMHFVLPWENPIPPSNKLTGWHKVKDVDCYFYII